MLTCISFSSTLLHLWDPKLYSSVRPDGPKSKSTASSLTIGPTSRPCPLQASTPNGQTWAKTKPWLFRPWGPHHAMLAFRGFSACARGPLCHSMSWWPGPACCDSCETCPPPLAGVVPDCPWPWPCWHPELPDCPVLAAPWLMRMYTVTFQKASSLGIQPMLNKTRKYILPCMHLNGVCSPHGLW